MIHMLPGLAATRYLLLLTFTAFLPVVLCAESSAPKPTGTATSPDILRLDGLTDPQMWVVPQKDGASGALVAVGGYLRAEVSTQKDQITELRLKQPQPIPEWADNLYFRCTNSGGDFTFNLDAIIRDAKGRELFFYSKSFYSFQQGLVIAHNPRRCAEYWHDFPAFRALSADTYQTADGKGYIKPERPYTFVGLRVRGQHTRPTNGQSFALYFAGFALSGLSPHTSSLYYTFGDQEFFGELAPVPYFTAGQVFSNKIGKQLGLYWELRRDYAGAPILTGSESWNYPDYWPPREQGTRVDARIADLARRIEIPVTDPGTYWVRVRTRWNKDGKALPDEVSEKEYRLYIDKGVRGKIPPMVDADAFAPNCYVRIAPGLASLLFPSDEALTIPVVFRKPDGDLADANLLVTVKNALGDVVLTHPVRDIAWDGKGRFTVLAELGKVPAGSYDVIASLLVGERVYDRVTRVVGRIAPVSTTLAKAAEIPATVPAWKELLASPEPLLFLCPIPASGDEARNDPKIAWEKNFKPFLDEAGELSKVVELQVPWAQVERLPGVYDWAAMDRFIDYAGSKGYRVSLTPEFRSSTMPEWVPSVCERGPDGRIFGASMYLFHRTRPNFLLAPEIRDKLFRFIDAMVRRYQAHPAVLSYFLCAEHPGDTPRLGWYEGYSAENLPFFIEHCRKQFTTIGELNRAWGVAFADFSELRHPMAGDPAAYKIGWLNFRREVIENFLKDYVRTVRAADKRRLILVYTSGVEDYRWFRDEGCMVADGGSHNNNSILESRRWGLGGFHHRTEDHRPGEWTAYFPSQIESSLFNIASGGGHTAHCKAYVRVGKRSVREQLADESKDLGKLKKLWPVWRELHQAYAYPAEVFLYGDTQSAIVQADSTSIGGGYGSVWATLNVQRAQLGANLLKDEAPAKDAKMVLMIGEEMRNLPAQTMERMQRYVQEGGTLVMTAGTGRELIGSSGGDWVLLRRFGFAAPREEHFRRAKNPALTVKGAVFADNGTVFNLREGWRMPYDPAAQGEKLAVFQTQPEACALSWKPFGKGRVVVVWADTIMPEGYPFLQDIARWAGAQIRVTTDQPEFWTNLQHNVDNTRFYGMVRTKPSPAKGKVFWLSLPEGDYKVTALVAGAEIGVMSAQKLRAGLAVDFPAGGAEFFRFEKIPGK